MGGGDGPRDVRSRCQVVVIGDQGTGKSSLIVAVATESFPEKVPPVLPPTRLPHDFYPDRVPLTIVDTSSRSVRFAFFFLFFFCRGFRSISVQKSKGVLVFPLLQKFNLRPQAVTTATRVSLAWRLVATRIHSSIRRCGNCQVLTMHHHIASSVWRTLSA
jgi:GTPase SAR1 family protein